MIVLKHERNRPGIKKLTRRCGAFAAVDFLFFRFSRLKRGGQIKLLRTAQVVTDWDCWDWKDGSIWLETINPV
jgi:hypothetical protein